MFAERLSVHPRRHPDNELQAEVGERQLVCLQRVSPLILVILGIIIHISYVGMESGRIYISKDVYGGELIIIIVIDVQSRVKNK